MMPVDFVFSQIYKGALRDGASERCAHQNALLGLEDYKKNKLGGSKVSGLIKARINKAIKESK